MASARVLSTTELGMLRYEDAHSSNLWPVEVCLRSSSPSASYKLLVQGHAPVPFILTSAGGARASLSVPPGPLTYQVMSAGALVSTGGLDVRPPEKPISSTRLAAALHERPPSGAVQLTFLQALKHPDKMTSGRWPVRFTFTEETWAARSVFVQSHKGLSAPVELTRQGNGDFEGVVAFKTGVAKYRFAVVPREATQMHAAPFTRLGWDDGWSEPNRLVTWPLRLDVTDQRKREVKAGVAHGQRVLDKVENEEGGTEKAEERTQEVQRGAKKVKGTQEVQGGAKKVKGTPQVQGGAKKVEVRQKPSVSVGARKEDGVVWGVVAAVATVACALGAASVMLLTGTGETETEKEVEVAVKEVGRIDDGGGGVGGGEVLEVFRHSRSQAF